jgi:hypothetical protein
LEGNHLKNQTPCELIYGERYVVKGGKGMKIFKLKRSRLLLITLALIIAFGVITASAQDKVKVKFTKYIVITKYEKTEVGDTEDHFLMQYEAKDVTSDGRFITYKTAQADYIKGSGRHKGYNKVVDREGGTYFSKFEGMTTVKKSPEGKPIKIVKGTYIYTKGTGKYEGIQGGGTYQGMMIGKGVLSIDGEGEYVIKK